MCGRNEKTSRGNQEDSTQETSGKTTTTASFEVDCSNNSFNATGCNIELAGKLLIITDGFKDEPWRRELYCLCKQLYSFLNGTNIIAEILTGTSKYKNCPIVNERANETFLQDELKSLNSEYLPIDGQAGMALILSDRPDMFDSLVDLPDEKQEPFIYFVSVGKGMDTKPEDSCHRQYRSINDASEISKIGLELERNACNPMGYLKNNSCLSSTWHTPTISTTASQVKMSVVVVSVIGALILTVVIVLCLIFSPKCKRNGKSRKETSVEFSAVDSRCGGLSEFLYSEARTFQPTFSRDSQNICSALWEKKTKKNKEKEENCHYLHMNFVEDSIDSSIRECMERKKDSDEATEETG